MELAKVLPEPPSNSLVEAEQPTRVLGRRKEGEVPVSPGWYPIKILDSLAAGLAAVSLVVAYAESSDFYSDPRSEIKPSTEYLRDFVMLVTFGLGAALLIRWRLYQRLRLADRKQGKMYTLSGVFWLGVELLACGGFPYPQVNTSFQGDMLNGTYEYSWDSLLLVLMLGRIYLLLLVFRHYSRWISRQTRVMSKSLGLDIDLSFALRAEFKRRPILTIAFFTLSTVFLLSIPLNVFERSYSGLHQCAIALQVLSNAMWSLIITMTTVGYGDTYPSTHLGRVVATAGCLFGTLLTSLMVLSLTIKSTLSAQELKAYTRIKRGPMQDLIRAQASDIIKEVFRFYGVQKTQSQRGKGQTLALAFTWWTKAKVAMRRFEERKRRLMDSTAEEILHLMGGNVRKDLKEVKRAFGECMHVRTRLDALLQRTSRFNHRVRELETLQGQVTRLLLALHNSIAKGNYCFRTAKP